MNLLNKSIQRTRFASSFILWSLACAGIIIAGATTTKAKVLVVEQTTTACSPNCFYYISLEGPIDHQTVSDFKAAINDSRIKQTQKRINIGPLVHLNSMGGSVPDAIIIGNIIRNSNFFTGVSENQECDSACVFVLASGVMRTASWGKVGIHRPHFDESYFSGLSQVDARLKYEQMEDSVRIYLHRMGMSDSLYTAMLRVSSDDIRYLSPKELKSYGLDGEDPAWSEWHRAQEIKSMGKDEYDVTQSLILVLTACNNKMDDTKFCNNDIVQSFRSRVEQCANDKNEHDMNCVKNIEREMIAQYQ